MTQFSELGLAAPILRAVTEAGYTTPTPIQGQAIPRLLDGQDLIGIAQTGTGKTAAFTLPLLHRLQADPQRPGPRNVRALVLAPTRELAAQIEDNVAIYAQHLALRHAVIFGGVKPRPQIKMLEPGVDLLIATPGRLIDHMQTGALRLDKVRTVVLDEADQMLDLGFMPAIRQIMGKLKPTRQTVLFSATMPKQIRQLASDFLSNPEEVRITPQSTPVERIEQTVELVERADKRDALREILSTPDLDRAIVFTRTKHGANRVVEHLIKDGLDARAIHGNKSQNQREKALESFRSGEIRILVATDIAARGIDVPGVSHVVNYDLPNVAEAYVHRIGRTARAGKDGIAISLVETDDRILLRDIEKLIGRHLTAFGAELEIPKGAKRPGSGGKSRPAPKRNAKPRRKPAGGSQAEGSSSRGQKPQGQKPRSQKPQGQKSQGQKSQGQKSQGQSAASGGEARKPRPQNARRRPANRRPKAPAA
ncbi:DEAD/DEAH box helicase [Maricaulis sp. D1M11]|uniref:DEAD/DEAH box helicase n=1 Tax=Maricaulis sp. D1M11 TaxID=3076117 RepID=UPI0039B3B7FD